MTVHDAGVLDTSIVAALKLFDPADLPDTVFITARPGSTARSARPSGQPGGRREGVSLT
jgi:hypothetical protein